MRTRTLRPALTLKKLDKLEAKSLRRIDALQREVFDLRTLRARLMSALDSPNAIPPKDTSQLDKK
jgi:hypothetical protein